MKRIYTPEGVSRLRRQAGRTAWAAGVTAGAALILCAALCLGVRTRNADARRMGAIVLFALGAGCAAFQLRGPVAEMRREAAHEAGVLREAPEMHEGRIVSIGAPFAIPKSITFLPVTLWEGERELPLKLNAAWSGGFPRPGESLRLETRRGYITAWEGETEGAGGGPGKRRKGRAALLLRSLLEALAVSALLWSWIFTFLTDAGAAQKVVVFADMNEGKWKEMSIQLEETAPEGIRFVQVHPFTYALMNSNALAQADLYIMTRTQAEEYGDWIAPLPEAWEAFASPKEPRGVALHAGEGGASAAGEYLRYGEQPGEEWYLYFGAESLHTGTRDRAAEEIAGAILRLP